MNIIKYLVISIFYLCLSTFSLKAGDDEGTTQGTNFSNLNVVFPSPEVSELGKYGAYPVGLFTGSINISIPLFELKSKSITIPITLKYASNGIRTDDTPTSAGMGWALSCGGVITRIVYDKPDEKYTTKIKDPPNSNFTYSINPDADLLSWLETAEWYDSERDEFFFNFGNYTGKFILDNDLKPVLLNYSGLKIEFNPDETDWIFKIITPDGYIYYFGGNDNIEGVQNTLNSLSVKDSWIFR